MSYKCVNHVATHQDSKDFYVVVLLSPYWHGISCLVDKASRYVVLEKFLCMYIYIYVRYPCFDELLTSWIYSCIQICIFIYVYMYSHDRYMHTCIHTCVHTYIRTYIHKYLHSYMHPCIHRIIHLFIHPSIQTNKQTNIDVYIYTVTPIDR